MLLKLCRREDLTREEARTAFEHVMSGDAGDAQIGGLLVGLAAKGATVEELVGAAGMMREKSRRIDAKADVVLDTCGTGGDVRGTFNVSTAAALVAAAAGVKVVKHGNRSASGKAGSADVLEHLGLNLDANDAAVERSLAETNLCFAFARSHHPAMKHVAAARTALGIPTIFNLLGPLTNPGRAKHQLLGVFAPELTEKLALVLRELGSRRAWVVHAHDGLDELSTLGFTRVSELRDGKINSWTLDARTLGIATARLGDLQVNDTAAAAAALTGVLAGAAGPMRDIAVLNAAAALVVAERVGDLGEGVALARATIDSGAARDTLTRLIAISKG